jgi:uncharacterized protein (TIGR00369 family)
LSDEVTEAAAPEGFSPAVNRGPFTRHNGPLFAYDDGAVWKRGFRVLPRHCNSFGLVHGGWLMAFADGLLAEACFRGSGTPILTIRMTSDFLNPARTGDWVEGTARTTRVTRSMAFAEGEIYAGSKLIFTATGVFKLMEGHARRAKRALSGEASS